MVLITMTTMMIAIVFILLFSSVFETVVISDANDS
jgi:hypothetical protein